MRDQHTHTSKRAHKSKYECVNVGIYVQLCVYILVNMYISMYVNMYI